MKKAKELAREIQYQNETTYKIHETHMAGLKPAINNLLHMYLPDDITIKEVETIAMVMCEMIWNPKDFVE